MFRMTCWIFAGLVLGGCSKNPVNSSSKVNPILFSSTRSGKSQLYSMEPDGSNVKQLTYGNLGYGAARWSPDGKTILFRSYVRPDVYPIYLMDANGNNERQLFHNGWTAAWSPDGKCIAYSKDPLCGGICGYDIFIWDLEKKTEYPLHTNTPDISEIVWDWSPDGQTLLIFTNNPEDNPGGENEIYIMDVQGNYVTRLTDNDVNDANPRWSPDGSKIAYSAFDGTDWDIFVMNVDGSDKRNLSNDDNLFSSEPCWSPDGSRILYSVSEGPKGYELNVQNIYSINLDGTGLTQLTRGNFVNIEPDWRW